MEKTFGNTVATLDGDKIVAVTLNGKAIKKSFLNALTKAQATKYWRLYDGEQTFTNPYTGVKCTLNALEASVYVWCMLWYNAYTVCFGKPMTPPIQAYDGMKYFLLEMNPQAYYDLLD